MGGTLAPGIATVRHPAFQLIGPAVEIAEQLMKFGVSMEVHVTRKVFELIHACHFRMTDRG